MRHEIKALVEELLDLSCKALHMALEETDEVVQAGKYGEAWAYSDTAIKLINFTLRALEIEMGSPK